MPRGRESSGWVGQSCCLFVVAEVDIAEVGDTEVEVVEPYRFDPATNIHRSRMQQTRDPAHIAMLTISSYTSYDRISIPSPPRC